MSERKIKVDVVSRGSNRRASENLEIKLNELRAGGSAILFVTVNTVNEYTIISIPEYKR